MLNLRRVSAKLLAGLGMVCALAVGAGAQATNFGTVAVGQTSPVTQLTFTFASSATIGSVTAMMQGAPATDFAVVSGGSCTAGASISAGNTCTANVTFSPILPGTRYGAVIVTDGSGNTVATDLVNGIGSGPQVRLVPRFPRVNPPWPTVGGGSFGIAGVSAGAVDGIGDVFFLVGSGAVTLPMEIPAGCTSAACVVTLAPNTTIPGEPFSLALDLSGNLFITVGTGTLGAVGGIYELAAAGGYQAATELPVSFGSGYLTGIALDQSGNIFVAISGSASLQSAALGLYEVSAAGGYSTATPIASAVPNPYTLTIDMSGNLFVSAANGNTAGVYEVLAAGGYTTANLLGNGFSFPGLGEFALPPALSLDQDGDVFFIDSATFSSIDEILASGGYQTVDSIPDGLSPSSVGIDASDNFYLYEGQSIDKLEFNDAYVSFGVPTLEGTTDTTDAPHWVTVENIGNAPLNLTGITPPSANFVLDPTTTTCSISTPVAAGDSCVVGFDFVPTAVGPLTDTLTLTDNALNATAAAQTVYLSGAGTGAPTVTVTPLPASITTAQALAVTVTVSGTPTPTGSVVLTSGSYTSSAATLSSGSATINIPAGSLPVGSDTLTATYTPDAASSSTYVTATGSNSETVAAPATAPTVTVTPSPSSITTAQALSVTVSVAGTPTPTGSVTLTSGTYSSGPVTLAAGSATINIPAGSLAKGADTLTATYTPDGASSATYTSATGSNTETVTAPATAPTVTVTPSPSSITTAQALSVTVSVAGTPTPTGSVTLTSGTYSSGPVTLAAGSATINIPAGSLAKGADTLTATYSPDAASAPTYTTATGSNTETVTAPATAPTVTVTPSPSSITTAQALSVTVTVAGTPTPTGSVTLTSGSYSSGAVTLAAGSAMINIPAGSLAVGSDTLTATYSPDGASSATYTSATGSNSETVAAPATAPTVTVTPSPSSITTAQALSVTVTVAGTPTPTGSVTLTSGSYSSGAVTLAAGSAMINIPAGSLAAGSDTLTATYSPDAASSATYTSATGSNTVTVTQAAAGPIAASPANVSFGTVNVGATSATASVTLTFPAAVTLSNLAALTQGVANLDFAIQASGTTCAVGAQGAGSTCNVALTFSPLYPGPRYGALVLYDNSTPANAVATVYLTGIGQSPLFAILPGVMTTVAGNGGAVSGGDGGQATSASLVPTGMALDGAGDIFVQDSSATSSSIRRIDAKSGIISKIAGGGSGCANQTDSLGDGCPATQASFYINTSLVDGAASGDDSRFVLDGAGNLYTTDLLPSASAPSGYTWIIRKIDAATGIVSNVTPASSSIPLCTGGGGLNPTVSNGTCSLEIAGVDGGGNVYLLQILSTSSANTNLLTFSPQSAALSSVFSGFQSPCIGTVICLGGGSIDGQGNLFLADQNGNVQKVIPSTGASTAWSGPNLGCDDDYFDPVLRMDAAGDGYFAPGALGSLNQTVVCEAGATAQSPVYYAGTDNYPYPFNGDNIPATQANIAFVGDIELDGQGNLYISDAGNNRIRKDTVGTGTPVVFPSTAQGATSAPINVTIQNIGNAALSLSSIVVSPQFAITNNGTTCTAAGPSIAPGTTCVLAITFAPTTTGTVTGMITFGDNSLNAASTAQIQLSGTATGAVLAATTTTLQTSAGSVVSGTSITLTATVAETSGTGVPTGTVTFYDGANSIGTGTLNGSGVATLTTSSLTVGSNSITAQYGGDGNNAASTSGAVSVTVTAPVASLTPASVPFGSVTSGTTSAPMSLTLANTGTSTLNISGITIVGANPSDFAISTGANACGATVAAGASCSIYVTFTPASASSFTATLQVADDAAGSPQASALTGTGTPAAAPIASLTPASVPFGSLTAGTTSAPMSLTLSNTGNAILNITGITIGGANPSDFALSTGANACGATLAAGATCSIYVTFTPASAASFSATLQVADNATGSPQAAAMTGTGTPPPAPAVTLAPGSVAFASQTTGTTSAATAVTLTNSGNALLTITGISIAGTDPTDFATTTGTNACGNSLAAGATCNIYVTFAPASAASFSATLTIADNAAGSPQTVALTGSGAAPPDFGVSATPATQTVQPGGSATYAVTVSASGGTFSNSVGLTVSGLPTGATGVFSPSSVTPGSASAASTLTVQTASTTTQTARSTAWPLAAPALAAVAFFFIPGKRRRRWISLGMLLLASLGAMTALSGCSGGFRFTEPAQTYTLTITGTSGSDTHSTTVQLTVE